MSKYTAEQVRDWLAGKERTHACYQQWSVSLDEEKVRGFKDAIDALLRGRESAKLPEGLRERIERAWHDHDEDGRVSISMADAQMLVEQVLIEAPMPASAGVTDASKPVGTYVCPICGYDKPHHHDPRLEPINWHADYRAAFEEIVHSNLHLAHRDGLFLGTHWVLRVTGQAHFLGMRADEARLHVGTTTEGMPAHPWSEFNKSAPWNGGYEQPWLDDLWAMYKQFVCAALEAAAPMLASARVPDGCFVALTEPTEEQVAETVYNINRKTAADTVTPDMVRQIWNGMVHARPIKQVNAMLAASPKPETIWPKNAREKAFSLAREMLKKGSAKPEKE